MKNSKNVFVDKAPPGSFVLAPGKVYAFSAAAETKTVKFQFLLPFYANKYSTIVC
jgi:hypothetical protein